jgi:uncharacterized protein YbaA (DUF1428 family)
LHDKAIAGILNRAKEIEMVTLNTEVYRNKADKDAAESALIAANVKSTKTNANMQITGTHWILSITPEKTNV